MQRRCFALHLNSVSSSRCHALIDLMNKPESASVMRDSRYPMWLLPPRGGRLCRKMLWLSRYHTSACSSCFHFFARWHFSCCSSVSSASESEAAVAALFCSFFSFFFSFLLASPCSESSPRSLLSEPVCCFLTGGSGVMFSVRPFLDGVCSLFRGVSSVGVSLGVAAFPGCRMPWVP